MSLIPHHYARGSRRNFVVGNYKMKISEEDIVITEWYASEVVDRKEVKFNGSPADWKTGDYSPPSTFFNRGD